MNNAVYATGKYSVTTFNSDLGLRMPANRLKNGHPNCITMCTHSARKYTWCGNQEHLYVQANDLKITQKMYYFYKQFYSKAHKHTYADDFGSHSILSVSCLCLKIWLPAISAIHMNKINKFHPLWISIMVIFIIRYTICGVWFDITLFFSPPSNINELVGAVRAVPNNKWEQWMR